MPLRKPDRLVMEVLALNQFVIGVRLVGVFMLVLLEWKRARKLDRLVMEVLALNQLESGVRSMGVVKLLI